MTTAVLEPVTVVPNSRALVQAYRFVRRNATAIHAGGHLVLFVFLATALATGTTQSVKPALLIFCLGISVITDLLWKRILNAVLLTTLIWIAIAHVLSNLGPWQEAVVGGLICFAVMLAIHWCFRGGEGDVKLFAPVGALLGAWHGVEAIGYGYMAAAPVAAVILLGRKAGLRTGLFRHTTLPMAPFFAIGVWLALRAGS